jgi:hypothetical protein
MSSDCSGQDQSGQADDACTEPSEVATRHWLSICSPGLPPRVDITAILAVAAE